MVATGTLIVCEELGAALLDYARTVFVELRGNHTQHALVTRDARQDEKGCPLRFTVDRDLKKVWDCGNRDFFTVNALCFLMGKKSSF